MRRALATLAIALSCAGCASTSPQKTFEDAADQVQKQSGHRLKWNQAGDDDKKVGAALAKITAGEMTVDQAVLVALLNNPTLLATYEDLTIAQADVVQAGLLRNPTFSATISAEDRDAINPNLILGVTQDFLDLLMIPARKKVAKAQLEQARLRLVDEVLDLAARTRTAYFMMQGATQVVAMREVIAQAADAAIELATRQHEAGNINDLDLANEAASFEQIKLDLGRSQIDLAAAREDLTKLLGVWGPLAGTFRIQPRLADIPPNEVSLERLEGAAIAQRADLAAAIQQARTLGYAASLARSSRWTGAIGIGANVARLNSGQVVVGPTATIELPIFDQRQAVVARIDALERAAQQTVRAVAVDVRSNVRRARVRVVALRRFAERYRDVILPTRESVVRLSQTQYDSMLIGIFQVLLARQLEINSYREYIEAVRDYWIARSDLERAIGGRLPGAPPATSTAKTAPISPSPTDPHSQH